MSEPHLLENGLESKKKRGGRFIDEVKNGFDYFEANVAIFKPGIEYPYPYHKRTNQMITEFLDYAQNARERPRVICRLSTFPYFFVRSLR